MAFIQTSDHGFVNADQVTSVSTYSTASDYGVRAVLVDSSVVPVESLGTFATQAEAQAAAAGLLTPLGLVAP